MAWEKIVISNGATVADTIKLIIRTINVYSHSDFVKKISELLKPGNSKIDYLKKVFDFASRNTKYQKDEPGKEQIFTPERSIREGLSRGIDCKKYTVLIASLLKAANIEPLLKVISYDGKHWEHIFIIVPIGQSGKYVTLDPVNKKKFNSEISHKKSSVFNLKGQKMTELSLLGKAKFSTRRRKLNFRAPLLYQASNEVTENLNKITRSVQGEGENIDFSEFEEISGINGMDDDEYNEYLGRTKRSSGRKTTREQKRTSRSEKKAARAVTKEQRKKKRKAIFKKVVKKVSQSGKKLALAPVRAAFLGLLALGAALKETPIKMHLAQKLAQSWKKDGGAKIKNIWNKFGGDPGILKNAIVKGSGVALSGAQEDALTEEMELSGLGVVTVAAAAAAIASATPVLIAVMKMLKENKKDLSPEAGESIDESLEEAESAIEKAEDEDHDEEGKTELDKKIDEEGGKIGSLATGAIDNFSDLFRAFILWNLLFSFTYLQFPQYKILIVISFFSLWAYSLRNHLKFIIKKLF